MKISTTEPLAAAGDTINVASGFMVALLSLALAFVLSTAIRTLPAIGADMLIRDLRVTPPLAGLVGAFPLAFAIGLLPVGAALDRYGVRRVALSSSDHHRWSRPCGRRTGVSRGCFGPNRPGVRLLGCVGRALDLCEPFGRSSDAIWIMVGSDPCAGQFRDVAFSQSDGLADGEYWLARRILGGRLFWIADAVVDLALGARDRASDEGLMPARSRLGDARDAVALALSTRLRWLSALAFTNFAAQIGLRGLWGGPWLMEAKGTLRLEAGNALLVFTVALVIGPLVVGMLDRRFGRTGPICAIGHLIAAAIMVLMVAGGPSGLLSGIVGLPALPGWWDILMLTLFEIVYGLRRYCSRWRPPQRKIPGGTGHSSGQPREFLRHGGAADGFGPGCGEAGSRSRD